MKRKIPGLELNYKYYPQGFTRAWPPEFTAEEKDSLLNFGLPTETVFVSRQEIFSLLVGLFVA